MGSSLIVKRTRHHAAFKAAKENFYCLPFTTVGPTFYQAEFNNLEPERKQFDVRVPSLRRTLY